MNGKPAVGSLEDGFVYLVVNAGDTLEIALELDMSVKFVRANSRVRSDAGQVAVMRGLLVYCVEQADNPVICGTTVWPMALMPLPLRPSSSLICWAVWIPSRCRLCVSRLIAMTPRYMCPPTLHQPLKQPY